MHKLVLVSLPKCGTNLLGGLFGAAGYAVTGEGIDNAFPSWCERLDRRFITEFPEATCCCFHGMSASALDGGLLQLWRAQDSPKVLFNYRDPRAALVSMINYLVGGRYSGAGWQQLGADILQALPEDQRVAFGIEYFDEALFKRYRESMWLLKHPKVLSTSFEALVGAAGGGCDDCQRREVARILAFAGCDLDADDLAPRVFDRGSRTFFSGKIDAWRQAFSPADLRAFEQRHGGILHTFGYAPEPS